jgi:hypothetical protein
MNAHEWGRRPSFSWYRKPGESTNHFWVGCETLCGRMWWGWKWRIGTGNLCEPCLERKAQMVIVSV